MKVAVAGSSGLIGTGLLAALRDRGHQTVRLVRRPPSHRDEVRWDPGRGEIGPDDLEGVEAIVNLAGAGIGDQRWTAARKAEIVASRVDGTRLLAEAAAKLDPRPEVFVAGSAVGWYGDTGDRRVDETARAGEGFLADLVQRWEAAAAPAEDAGIRTVRLRSGVVLSRAGGALARQLPLFRLGAGGRIGKGGQWLPWVSLADEVGAILHVLGTPSLSGPVNAVAPEPVTNREFTKALGRALRRPTFLPVPVPAVKALLGGELVEEMLLKGQRVVPRRLQQTGFEWRHPTLEQALADIL